MTKGFITLATGEERYFKMALNLLKSYRLFSVEPLPFAILTDHHNQYTEEFDKVIILENAKRSYIDKLSLLTHCPFDMNIFIDADCLAYHDLNDYWDVCDFSNTLSCFGNSFSLDNKHDGYFKKEDTGKYENRIKFITHVHGGVYFIKNSPECSEIYDVAMEINDNYSNYKFKYFDKPADESILALCMSVFNCRPIVEKGWHLIFYPTLTNFKADIFKGYNSCIKYGESVTNAYLIHWQNYFTDKAIYKSEVDKLNVMYNRKMAFQGNIKYFSIYSKVDIFTKLKLKSKFLIYKSMDFYYDFLLFVKTKLSYFLKKLFESNY